MLKETLPEVQLRKNIKETLEVREKRIFQKVNTIYKVIIQLTGLIEVVRESSSGGVNSSY